MDIGLRRIVGDKTAFLNATRDFIVGGHLLALSEHKLGIEILEDVTVDEELMRALRELAAHGHTIVLDDFVYHDSLRPLVEVAHIVKIDILDQQQDVIREHVRALREYNVKLLAEKIETPEELEFCRQLGFDYYQGFFFCKPNTIRGQRIPASRSGVMKMLSTLQAPIEGTGNFEAAIRPDLALSYQLLHLVNTVHYGLSRRVESIRDALVVVGADAMRNWASLILMSRIAGKPQELMVTALVRARMCELLAVRLNRRDRDSFFSIGLLSVLDALFDRPMGELLKSMPVADEVRLALTGKDGLQGHVLDCVLAWERGEWEKVRHSILRAQEPLGEVYVEAVDWADAVSAELAAAG